MAFTHHEMECSGLSILQATAALPPELRSALSTGRQSPPLHQRTKLTSIFGSFTAAEDIFTCEVLCSLICPLPEEMGLFFNKVKVCVHGPALAQCQPQRGVCDASLLHVLGDLHYVLPTFAGHAV